MSINEIHYTICPVGNSSYIAANKGWLKDGLAKLGVEPVLLQSLPREKWIAHYNYDDNALFREGGNIPPIWARSNGAEVILIGLTFLEQKNYILVNQDSKIDSIEDLIGLKLAIPTRPDFIIDFHRATAQHGFETALAARGVSKNTVEFIDLPVDEAYIAQTADKKSNLGKIEVEKLKNKEVDAIYAGGTHAQKVLETGRFKVIYEISANRKLLSQINNIYPNILTVSRRLAEEHPEVVVEYVKQTILAAEWAQTNRYEVLDMFSKQTHGTIGQVNSSLSFDFNKRLVPELTKYGLYALESQKRFLYDHGYIDNDFDIEEWADDSFIKKAFEEIEKDKKVFSDLKQNII